MCGIAGFWMGERRGARAMDNVVVAMASAIAHRGPDDAGHWCDTGLGVALGFRRLSIIDLSPAGSQPMLSPSGRYVVIFNGEIYNHAGLREKLVAEGRGVPWRGHSDTETLCACFEFWGIETTLSACVGMLAIAVWDQQEHKLHLARDRFGEKPLYYGWLDGTGDTGPVFVFGSELKALRAFPTFAAPVDREALALYLRFAYIPTPRSIYKGIFKLEPGCLLTISGPVSVVPCAPPRPGYSDRSMSLDRWWSVTERFQAGAEQSFEYEDEALSILEVALQRSVELQSLADVPLGAFLSGGVDSSTVVALMQRASTRPVQTFTVGFGEAKFDESESAARVAAHLGTNHTSFFVTATDARNVIPRLSSMYDEPFADSSQIPTHLVCAAARQRVTVALSGDAGDELFGGYNRYIWAPRVWSWLSMVPESVREAIVRLAAWAPPMNVERLGRLVQVQHPGQMLSKLVDALRGARSVDDLYFRLVSAWPEPSLVMTSGIEPASFLRDPVPDAAVHPAQRMMYRDSVTYLPDDILCKVDRAAMAVSLETRLPFLDHRVAEIAWRMPLSMKIRDGVGKWALRQILYKYVPREIIERPKTGFGIPIGQWLRAPLRGWANAQLDEARLAREGYLSPQLVREAWSQHLSGRYDRTNQMWTILMFQSWLEENR
jgi:asparagine synthase (glutamine-hydrolysing)